MRGPLPAGRALLQQAAVFAALAALIAYLGYNLEANLAQRAIRTGFAFLGEPAGFGIGEALIPFKSQDSYARALLVGLLNTLMVAALAGIASTLLGTLIGVARLSRNPLVAFPAGAYVEAIRNVPLLLQLFLWYAVLTQLLPPVERAVALLPGLYLSKNGLNLPALLGGPAEYRALAALLVGALLALVLRGFVTHRSAAPPAWLGPAMLALILLPAAAILVATDGAVRLDIPVPTRFGFRGGGNFGPELMALLTGLSLYNTAFIGEIVRSGIQSVGKGQREAASALGLRGGQTIRLIVIPQAMRVVIPPLASQYLNLVKNSSLAVAIGYPDLMSVAGTTLNQTGQAVEVIGLTMAVYLVISFAIALAMNLYNARILRWRAA
jgi:general L-amino acid transport system permease protein